MDYPDGGAHAPPSLFSGSEKRMLRHAFTTLATPP